MRDCRHCKDRVTLDPADAEVCDSEWNEPPAPGQWCHQYTGGVYCDGVDGTRAEPDLRVGAQLEEGK